MHFNEKSPASARWGLLQVDSVSDCVSRGEIKRLGSAGDVCLKDRNYREWQPSWNMAGEYVQHMEVKPPSPQPPVFPDDRALKHEPGLQKGANISLHKHDRVKHTHSHNPLPSCLC